MKLKWLGKILPEPNGCGPEGFQWAVPNLIFKPACNLHDNLFSAQVGFFTSNWAFYHRMRYLIWKKKKHFGYEIIAFIYFVAVTIGGAPFYFKWGTKIKRVLGKYFNIKDWK